MGKIHSLYLKAKASPHNLGYSDLCKLAESVGFEFKRQNGSHKIYKHTSIREVSSMMNFQDDNGKAKPFQVRQLIDFIEEYDLI